jgi:hypothetical protein
VEIEIIDRRSQPPPKPRFVVLKLLVALLILGVVFGRTAHAQPTEWRFWQEGFVTRLQGIDHDGRTWTGTPYQQGFVTSIYRRAGF